MGNSVNFSTIPGEKDPVLGTPRHPPDKPDEVAKEQQVHMNVCSEKMKARFAPLRNIPFHTIYVVLLCAGIGGLTHGIREANRRFGNFRILLAVDNDPECVRIHGKTYPNIPVVQHTLGKSHQKIMKLIRKFVSPTCFDSTVLIFTPDCKTISTAYMRRRRHSEGVRLLRSLIKLAHVGNYRYFKAENVRSMHRHVHRVAPYCLLLNMRSHAAKLMSNCPHLSCPTPY